MKHKISILGMISVLFFSQINMINVSGEKQDNLSTSTRITSLNSKKERFSVPKTTSMEIQSPLFFLTPNTETTIDTYKDVSSGDFKGNDFRAGWMGHFIQFSEITITKVCGVYSSFIKYYDHNSLETITDDNQYITTENIKDSQYTSISFDNPVDYHAEVSLEANINIEEASSTAEVNQKTGYYSYSYDCTYTRNQLAEPNSIQTFNLASLANAYCPEGYKISIGLIGTYYVIHGNYQEYTNWWWGDYPTWGCDKHEFTAVIANPSNFYCGFVYKKQNSSNYYYSN